MIYEKLPLTFDVQRLQDQLLSTIIQLPPVRQGLSYGGWSVYSSNGSYLDGWGMGSECYVWRDGKLVFDFELAAQKGLKSIDEYCRPTEICVGALRETMQKIETSKFYPRRARIAHLPAQGQSSYHRDGPDNEYGVRLHVPIITNPDCVFVCDEGQAHMPADGSAYLVRVNRMHQVFNQGATDRYHLIMDVFDFHHQSQHHRHPQYSPYEVLKKEFTSLL